MPTRIDGRDRPACPVCGFADFMHVQIGANAVVERDGGVLLVRLNYGPRNGRWALPGGLVENDETAEEAARRETKEETGFDISLDGLLAAWMRPGFPIFVVVYRAHVIGGSLDVAPDEASEAAFFPGVALDRARPRRVARIRAASPVAERTDTPPRPGSPICMTRTAVLRRMLPRRHLGERGMRTADGMRDLGRSGLSPVARFSLALGVVLVATAIALSAGAAYLVMSYVRDETADFTADAVGSHFGPIFSDDVFARALTNAERAKLTGTVAFHFSIYNVVRTQFLDRSGAVVFSYDPSELGRRVDPAGEPGLTAALAGNTFSRRARVVGDTRYLSTSGYVRGGGAGAEDDHGHAAASGGAKPAEVDALEAWVPVREGGKIIGAAVVWRDVSEIDAAMRQIQLSLAGVIAAAAALLWLVLRDVYVRSARRIVAQATALEGALAETERTYDTTLQALSNALDVRDSETEGHSQRVLRYMELIADRLSLGLDDLPTLRRGALLHDIGKIGVPDNVLRKPAALSEAEWAVMRRHPEHGAGIISSIPFLADVARIVRHHHERWDGEGYPDGLAGDAIPLGARIFAVADSFDAMTSDRPYRRAMDVAEACREIARCRGGQFDPLVADAFLRIPVGDLEAIADEAPHLHSRAVAG